MMKHNVLAALLLAAATLMAVGCDKDNDNTSSTPQAKVSRVYSTSSILLEVYNSATDTWDTMMYLPGERRLQYEFRWTGDRVDTVVHLNDRYALLYDEEGRLVSIKGVDLAIRSNIAYDAEGRLSHVDEILFGPGGIDTSYMNVMDYLWSGGRLAGVNLEVVPIDESNPHEFQGMRQSMSQFAWTGDNITSSVLQEVSFSGVRDTTVYNYEYTNIPNPFFGFPYFQVYHQYLVNANDPTDGFCKNMISRIYNDESERNIEYTTSGDRITAIHEVYITTKETSRQLTITDYEIEYAE